MKPKDQNLYNKTKAQIYKKHPKHSAYRSGLLVKAYKKKYHLNIFFITYNSLKYFLNI